MRLQEKLDAFTANLVQSGKFPPALLEKLHRSTAELIASGQADRAVSVMAPAAAPPRSGRGKGRIPRSTLLPIF